MTAMNELQCQIWKANKAKAALLSLCPKCDWLNIDEETGIKTCISATDCMYPEREK